MPLSAGWVIAYACGFPGSIFKMLLSFQHEPFSYGTTWDSLENFSRLTPVGVSLSAQLSPVPILASFYQVTCQA